VTQVWHLHQMTYRVEHFLTSPLNISLTSSLNSFTDSACIDDDLDFEPPVVDTAGEGSEPVVEDNRGGSNSDLPQSST